MPKNRGHRRRSDQRPKDTGNRAYIDGMMEIRRSNAAGTHRTETDYRRKPKHPKRGWE